MNNVIDRDGKGKIRLHELEATKWLADMFNMCETEDEVNWLVEQLDSIIDCVAEEAVSSRL